MLKELDEKTKKQIADSLIQAAGFSMPGFSLSRVKRSHLSRAPFFGGK